MTIFEEILQGKHDNKIDNIIEACKERLKIQRDVKSLQTISQVRVGDNVKLKNLSPKYINGKTVEVVDKKKKSLMVKSPHKIGRFGADVPFKVPASCVELI